jgi:hypothetical protein
MAANVTQVESAVARKMWSFVEALAGCQRCRRTKVLPPQAYPQISLGAERPRTERRLAHERI